MDIDMIFDSDKLTNFPSWGVIHIPNELTSYDISSRKGNKLA
jgi:hypothetical protein